MEYPQGLNRDANRIPTTGIGQTRNGMDEFINLVALYEYDKDTNLYFPPGILPNPSAPRVDIADQTVVSAIKAAATTAATLATEATVIQERLGNADDPKTTDPDAQEATALGLLRGLLDYIANTKAVFDDVHDTENHLLKTSATGGNGSEIDYTALIQSILTQAQTTATETTLAALKGVIEGLIENGSLKTIANVTVGDVTVSNLDITDRANRQLGIVSKSTDLIAAGQATASAADQSISTSGFSHINVYNTGNVDIILAIDEDSTGSTAKKIIILPKQPFSDDIKGSVLHYSAVSSCAFNYQLR